MKYFINLLEKHIDFPFALALIAIFGTAGFLSLQFKTANTEFTTLDASMYSVVRSQPADDREEAALNNQLEQLEKDLDALNF